MDLAMDFNNVSPQLQYLLENVQLMNPSTLDSNGGLKGKEAKLNDDTLDLGAAYLGPQIWNKMMISDDLKLEAVDLDILLNDSFTNDIEKQELDDLSLLLETESTAIRQPEPRLMSAKKGDLNVNQSAPANPVFSSISLQQQHTQDEGLKYDIIMPQVPNLQPVIIQGTTVPPSTRVESPTRDVSIPEKPDDSQFQRIPSPLQCDFKPNITDVIISTPLDGKEDAELFDPRKRAFTDEELKPQPIIRKARKMYVLNECKDTKYWQKREKNNVAAKRSREARRIKENQIAMRANFLEKENDTLRTEVHDLRKELKKMIEIANRYEQREKK